MAQKRFRGLEQQEELFEKDFLRDTRPLWRQILDVLRGRTGGTVCLGSLAILPFFFPETSYFVLPVGLVIYGLRKSATREDRLPFRLPEASGLPDFSDPIPGRKKFFNAAGIFFMGNEFTSFQELWLKAKDILTHMLILGTTGSGKSEAMVSLSFNALAMGSGFFYIDPKAAPKLAVQLSQMCRLCGRDDDFLVVNYSTAGKIQGRNPKRLSNTTNPFAIGSPEGLTNLLTSLIPVSEGDNAIFSQNAQTLVTGLMYALCELRDRGEQELSIDTIRDTMTLQRYVELAERPDLSETTLAALRSFLSSVGWQEGKPLDKQPRSLPEQFGYARAYFGLTLASLADTYGHVYKTSRGEVNMYDVIKNRRILVTLLPAMEKSPQELANLGKISLSSVRLACSVGLGDKLEGAIEDVLDSLPTDSPTPFLSLTDEYAAIPTPGYAEVLTQGRGLGIAAVVGSQDYAGIKGADEKGAQQIIANTKVKWAMKTEDATSTWELFRDIAAESSIMQTAGYHVDPRNPGMGLAYRDQAQANVTKVARVHIRDLQEQIEGEFHAFFNGGVIRGMAFFANPPLPKDDQLRINKFLKVAPPDAKRLSIRMGSIRSLSDLLAESIRQPREEVRTMPPQFAALVKVFEHPRPDAGRMDTAIEAFMAWRAAFADSDGSGALDIELDPDVDLGEGDAAAEAPTLSDAGEDSADDFLGGMEDDDSTGVEALHQGHLASSVDATRMAAKMQESTAWLQNLLVDKEMVEDMAQAEELLGADPQQAQHMAEAVVRQMQDSFSYPDQPIPVKDATKDKDLSGVIHQIIGKAKARRGGS